MEILGVNLGKKADIVRILNTYAIGSFSELFTILGGRQ